MNLCEIFLDLLPKDIAYLKFIIESYEGVGIVRTVDQKRAIVDLLVVEDFMQTALSILASLQLEVSLTEIPRPPDIGEDWLLREMATEETPI